VQQNASRAADGGADQVGQPFKSRTRAPRLAFEVDNGLNVRDLIDGRGRWLTVLATRAVRSHRLVRTVDSTESPTPYVDGKSIANRSCRRAPIRVSTPTHVSPMRDVSGGLSPPSRGWDVVATQSGPRAMLSPTTAIAVPAPNDARTPSCSMRRDIRKIWSSRKGATRI
jgi:hypothetical protein